MDRWGDFELVEEIGRGGFGAVYRAHHPTLGVDVALKLVPVSGNGHREIDKALDEPRRLAAVRHEHVVAVHDARYLHGHVGICMELVRGQSLDAIVAERGTYHPAESVTCIRTVADALAAVHRAGIVHNDVKARNVMREQGGRLVLMDFGAGRRLQEPDATTGLMVVGTPLSMAPEIFRLRERTFASDIYSLGVLWFYLLTGAHPVEGRSLAEISDAHAARRRRYLADLVGHVPADLERVLERALEPDPAQRYQSCGALLRDLEGTSGRGTFSPVPAPPLPVSRPAPPDPPPPRPWSWPNRSASTTTAALVGGIVVVITAIGFLACQAYAIMFGLAGEFAREPPWVWFEIGLATLPLPIVGAVAALVAWSAGSLVWRIARRRSARLDTWSAATTRTLAQATRNAGLDDAASLATVVLIIQTVVVVAMAYAFSDILTAFTTPIVETVIPEHARLAAAVEGRWHVFRIVMGLLTLAGGYAWWHVAKYRRAAEMGFTRLTAGIAVTVASLLLTTVPWRIVQDADLETAMFGSERCFVTADRDTRLQLFCPGAASRSFAVLASDPELVRHGPRVNVFATIASRPGS